MCLTCSIVKGAKIPPGGLIYKDNEVVIHHCIDVDVPGYLILSPIRHVTTYQDLTQTEIMTIAMILKEVVAILQQIPDVEKVYILNLAEETSHFHFHIFPRYCWMLDSFNAELFSDGKLDGAKLFSYYRRENKVNKLQDIANLEQTIEFIRNRLNSGG
ncbi:HIT family protein [Pectinatus frisingensis]|uniref:HIT family protein n=1 Tax=Pectinatus frisingensis TaxID=865 RepID=UPI0018C61AEB|nr:HIT domain-containing protein [Pectinatus frisingensis]